MRVNFKVVYALVAVAFVALFCVSGEASKANASSCHGETAKASCSGPTLAKGVKRVADRSKQAVKKVFSVLKRDCSGN